MKLEMIDSRHIQPLLQIAADKRIAQTSGVPENCTEKDIAEWISRSQKVPAEEMHFVLVTNDKVLGCCILKKIDWQNREAELSYWLGVDFWGKGLGSTAARLMADAAFDILGMQVLNSHYLKSGNAPSGRILEKLGFVADPCKQDLPAEGRFLTQPGDVWTFVKLSRTAFS
jgi:RimJ/RimL family protein N-acetyltransferase|tara:strand:- start:770 stop:1282 length:513 start_codon:yes stop_codon:yes gene_type:complete